MNSLRIRRNSTWRCAAPRGVRRGQQSHRFGDDDVGGFVCAFEQDIRTRALQHTPVLSRYPEVGRIYGHGVEGEFVRAGRMEVLSKHPIICMA